jgi:hypothetical protein
MRRDEGAAPAASRRRYESPQLRRIRLVPDEAVLASCKNNATSGPAGPVGKCATNPAVCSHSAS